MTLDYQAGSTVLHRAPALVKLLGVLVCSVAFSSNRSLWVACVTVVAANLVLLGCSDRARACQGLFAAAVISLPTFIYACVLGGSLTLFVRGANLSATVLLALVLVVTTSPTVLSTSMHRFLSPVIGARAAFVGSMCVSLVIRFIPLTFHTFAQTRDALRARHAPTRLWNTFVPSVIRLIGTALAAGDALQTRHITK